MGQHANPQLERQSLNPPKLEYQHLSRVENTAQLAQITTLLKTFLSRFKFDVVKTTFNQTSRCLNIGLVVARLLPRPKRQSVSRKTAVLKYKQQTCFKLLQRADKTVLSHRQLVIKRARNRILRIFTTKTKRQRLSKLTFLRRVYNLTKVTSQLRLHLSNFLQVPVNVMLRQGTIDSVPTRKSPQYFKPRFNSAALAAQLLEKLIKTAILYREASHISFYVQELFRATKNHRAGLNTMKNAIMRLNLKQFRIRGIKLLVWGKLNGMDRSKGYKISHGAVPVQTLNLQVSADTSFVNTRTGTFGIKSYIIF